MRLRGRAPADLLNGLSAPSRERTQQITADGITAPIVYGRARVPGLLRAVGTLSGDLVVAWVWAIGEIEQIEVIYINDAAVPGAVTLTNYTGTSTQTTDATLTSAIAGWNDALVRDFGNGPFGIAYTVARIPASEIAGFPRAEAVIKGTKNIFDPRTSTTAYTDNPALCYAHYCLDKNNGVGISDVLNVGDAADYCDFLIEGVTERAKISLYLPQSRAAVDYMPLFEEHADLYTVFEGDTIRFIPDSPVDLDTVPTITRIMQDSLSITALDDTDSPTEVEIRYTDPTSTAEPWQEVTATVSLPGVSEGTLNRIPTSVSLPGVFRQVEASLKALARLRRMQDRVQYQWISDDSGVIRQRGDVVKLTVAARGLTDAPCRITGVDIVSAGRYRVTATKYDISHYPDELVLPEDTGVVPVGAITLLNGTTVPDGWDAWTTADGRYIIGGEIADIGNTGGAATFAGFSGTTTTNGNHSAPIFDFLAQTSTFGGSTSGDLYGGPVDGGGHNHTFSTGTITPVPATRSNQLIIKTGSAGLEWPLQSLMFGLSSISIANRIRITSVSNRLLRAATAAANSGAWTQNILVSTSSADDTHAHRNGSTFATTTPTLDFGPFPFSISDPNDANGGGLHDHLTTFSMSINTKRRRLALWGQTAGTPVVPGDIIMWEGGSIPADWVLCDGNNGTPDMRDYFCEIAGIGDEQTATGNNTVAINGQTVTRTHSHGQNFAQNPNTNIDIGHTVDVGHNHTITSSGSWSPTYYVLAFLMFAPA